MIKLFISGKIWMWGLIAIITTFMLFFISLSVWSFQDDVELVYDNYYAKDVVFEQQIRRVERTDNLKVKPIIDYYQQTRMLRLYFPPKMGMVHPQGEVLLFRPADLHKDMLFSLDLIGDTLQTINLTGLDSGLWRVKLNWASGGLEYYLEHIIMIR